MSHTLRELVWDHSPQKGGKLLLLLAIADRFNENKGYAYPSIRDLADRSRMTERQVQRLIRELVAEGALEVRWGQGPRGCHLYTPTICHPDISDTGGVTFPPGGVT